MHCFVYYRHHNHIILMCFGYRWYMELQNICTTMKMEMISNSRICVKLYIIPLLYDKSEQQGSVYRD